MQRWRGKYLAVDFDGTCVTHEYPNVGRDVGAAPVLLDLVAEGAQIILWTMRSERSDGTNPLQDAVEWFAKNGIPLYGINHNPSQGEWTSSPKAYAHVYIDDAAYGCPLLKGLKGERPFVNWAKVRADLLPEVEDVATE